MEGGREVCVCVCVREREREREREKEREPSRVKTSERQYQKRPSIEAKET